MRRGEWVLLAQWVEPYLDLDMPAACGDRERSPCVARPGTDPKVYCIGHPLPTTSSVVGEVSWYSVQTLETFGHSLKTDMSPKS